MQFDWVLIDECQDLNPAEMDTVFTMVGGKIFAVGDVLQSIYGFQGAMGPSVIDLFKHAGCQEASLKNNYRSCPAIVNRLNMWFERDLISTGIKETGLTAVLCRRNDDVFEVSEHLKKRGISHHLRLSAALTGDAREWDVIGKNTLHVSTIHSAKGREFDKVILYNWFPDDYGEEARVYYVAMSRASKEFAEVVNLRSLEDELE